MIIDELENFFENPQNVIDVIARFRESHAGKELQVKMQLASYSAQLATVRKAITNTTKAISSHGISNALSKSLAAHEEEETHILLKINQVKTQSTTPIIVPTIEQAKAAAVQIKNNLRSEDPIIVRQTLLGSIFEIQVDRIANDIAAHIIYYHAPSVKKKTIDNTVSMSPPTVGAPIYRHSIFASATIPKSGRPKKKTVK